MSILVSGNGVRPEAGLALVVTGCFESPFHFAGSSKPSFEVV